MSKDEFWERVKSNEEFFYDLRRVFGATFEEAWIDEPESNHEALRDMLEEDPHTEEHQVHDLPANRDR